MNVEESPAHGRRKGGAKRTTPKKRRGGAADDGGEGSSAAAQPSASSSGSSSADTRSAQVRLAEFDPAVVQSALRELAVTDGLLDPEPEEVLNFLMTNCEPPARGRKRARTGRADATAPRRSVVDLTTGPECVHVDLTDSWLGKAAGRAFEAYAVIKQVTASGISESAARVAVAGLLERELHLSLGMATVLEAIGKTSSELDAIVARVKREAASGKDDADGKCIVCWCEDITREFRPCKHKVVCAECSKKVTKECPVCRQAINKVVKVKA
eukprot:tig00000851_g4916.t1